MRKGYWLVLILVGLAIYGFIRFINYKSDQPFHGLLFESQPQEIEYFSIHPVDSDNPISFFKEEEVWFASKNNTSVQVSEEKILSILTKIQLIKTDSILADVKPSSLGFASFPKGLILIKKTGKPEEVFHLSSGLEESSNLSFLKLPNADEIFLLSGDSGKIAKLTHFQLSDFRDHTFTKFAIEDVLIISFSKGDSTIHLEKNNNNDWVWNEALLIDSLSMFNFLKDLSNLKADNFEDTFDPISDANDAKAEIVIKLKNRIEPLVIRSYKYEDGNLPYVLSSSQQKGTWFASDENGIYRNTIGALEMMTGWKEIQN
ncbi:MAG: DUF4340 domain-containing protein [Saprospiraceae bacterium]